MRVATWNCRSGTDAKLSAVLDAFTPDVLVMPESAKSPALAVDSLLAPAIPHAWTGSIASKGLGVFAPTAEQLTVRPLGVGAGDWSLAARAEAPDWASNVIGIWTVPRPGGAWRSPYLRALDDIFHRHEVMLAQGDTIVAGDFNCCGTKDDDELPRFLDRVRDTFGLVSAYHRWSGEALGSETSMTHWWRGSLESGFHIDFVLVPENWTVLEVAVGSYSEWGSTDAPARSDHAPLMVEVIAPH